MYKADTLVSMDAFNSANQKYVHEEKQLQKARIYKRNNDHRIVEELQSVKLIGKKDVIDSKLPSFILKDYKVPELKAAGFTQEKIKEIKAKKSNINENKTAINRGKTFERRVFNYVKSQKEKGYLDATILYGAWIKYFDKNGLGYAQPDILLFDNKTTDIYILECKLTQTDDAILQLRSLYKPLIEELYPNRKVYLIQIFKNIKHKQDLVYSLIDFMRNPNRELVNLHYVE